MAISYVGGTSASNSSGSISSISLTSLTGGSNSSPSTGDIVIISINNNDSSVGGTYPVISGYTSVAELNAQDSDETWSTTAYKIMTSTPDTSISFTVNNSYGVTVVVQVWRGVDQINPIDVTTTTATGINSSQADPPSITPNTSGSVVLAIGHNAYGPSSIRQFTAVSSGYSNEIIVLCTAAIDRGSTAIGSKSWTSGAEDPAAFTVNASGASSSWTAVTMVLKPLTGYAFTADLGTFTYTGVNANTLKGFKVIADKGTFTLTGISAGLMKGFGMVASVGSFAYTGISAGLRATRRLTASVGTFTYTGIASILKRGFGIVASAGSYILTGINATLRPSNIWSNVSKSISSWTNTSKNSSTWSNTSKNNSSWTNPTKS